MAQPLVVQPVFGRAHRSQNRIPAGQAHHAQGQVAPHLQAQFQQHLNGLRLRAGPQLCANLPPWYRPGDVNTTQHRPAWPGRSANYMIPMAIHDELLPDLHTEQDELNTFLRHADTLFGGIRAAQTQANAPHPATRARNGPRVFPTQVSTRNSTDRQAAFPWHMVDHVRMFNPAPRARPVMTLAQYSGTIAEVGSELRLTEGTLISVASPAPLQGANGVQASSAWRGFLQTLPAGANVVLPAPPHNNNYWHAAGIFVQRHGHYPRLMPPTDYPPGTPSYRRYQFNGRFQCVRIYDSCYINESTPANGGPGLVRQSLAQGNPSRISEHCMLSTVQRLLFGQTNGLAAPTANARCRWIRDAGTVRIGGGGNIGGIDECQRMTAIWMLQVAELSRALSRAIADLFHHPSANTERAFLQAEGEWNAFFLDYTDVRP